MNIAFILPMPSCKINGGYKIVYEYANYLVRNGDDITILYNADKGKNSKGIPELPVYFVRIYLASSGPKWFDLDKKIKQKAIYNLEKYNLDVFDVVVATAATTSRYVAKAQGRKFYFVQDFEIWANSEEDLIESYNLPFEIITISRWLERKLKAVTHNKIQYIPNGINNDVFKNTRNSKNRVRYSVCMLYHKLPRKGADIGIRVLFRLKEKYPEMVAYLFGSPKRDSNWPEWIKYQRNATETQVAQNMNKSRVFLCTSRQEGFGLTGLESIFCGCALVTTDCLGIREYANTNNSLICKVDDEEAIYKSVCMLFDDNALCDRLIAAGEDVREKFSLESSQSLFYKTLRNE